MGAVGDALAVLSLPDLPDAGEAGLEVLAALLRGNPVSTFISSDDQGRAATGDLSLVLDLGLQSGPAGAEVVLAGEAMGTADFAARLAGLVNAFSPERRQMAFVRITDPEGLMPATLEALSGAFTGAGLGLSLAMVGPDAAACGGARNALHYAVLAGVADRAPFGDGNGSTSVDEAAEFVSLALERDVARGAACAAEYSILVRGGAGGDLVDTPAKPLITEMESQLYTETFEALFLMSSEEPGPVRAFLQSCTFCPSEADLSERLQVIAERELTLALETNIWEGIREDDTPVRLSVYLENCQLCAYEGEARARISTLEAAAAAREEENAAYRALVAAKDLSGLMAWADSCVACDFETEARAEIAKLESDAAFIAERDALDAAMSAMNAGAIREWLESCTLCGGEDEAVAMLNKLVTEAEVAGPCVAAAGLPQQGGPRLLGDIDQPAARATCARVLAEFPGSPVATVALGRVEQAAGNLPAALDAYEDGMAAGLAEAYGLAAHAAYAPGNGSVADYARAAELAQIGYERGDWLSGEVLAVLYSRELVDGKSAEDAFMVAETHAQEGNPVAQFFTGYFSRIGVGVDASDEVAVQWLAQSSAQGYLHANSFLAEILEQGGEGVEPDPERAASLYWEALAGGDPTARDRLSNQIGDRSAVVVREIQTQLREAGAYTGRVDGIGGNNTASAVIRYAESLVEDAQ